MGQGLQPRSVCRQFLPSTSTLTRPPPRDGVSWGHYGVTGARALSPHSSSTQKRRQEKRRQRRAAKMGTQRRKDRSQAEQETTDRRLGSDKQLGSGSHRAHTGHPRNLNALI